MKPGPFTIAFRAALGVYSARLATLIAGAAVTAAIALALVIMTHEPR